MYKCQHCLKDFETLRGASFHANRCHKNSNRRIQPNQYTTNPDYEISEETRSKLSASTTKRNNIKWAKPGAKAAQSVKMQQVVQQNPQSYSSSNRGRTKQIIYNGVKLQGGWELIVAQWLDFNSIIWKKPETPFPYVWDGNRSYFPDFYLPDLNLYIEVKGYKTDRDKAKWEYFPHALCIIQKDEIKSIEEKIFNVESLQNIIYGATGGIRTPNGLSSTDYESAACDQYGVRCI